MPPPDTLKTILLVEDDHQDVQLMLAALEQHHLADQVFVVHDGAEALDYLYYRGQFTQRNRSTPALVLLDLKMPKVNGLEVLKIIKADPHLRTIPVVVLSSSRETADLAECYQHGVNGYVVKAVDYQGFMTSIRQIGTFWGKLNEPPPDLRVERQ
ncbi:response regulator [Prosthecobacter sp.]|uniref:response regulator n=1 Tax=Prosthecobacter sp. TaxID=1965333 RepID=UPI00248870D4|nr:response regulator [Prosthecobacter sp.]MDI1312090.1 response regulator [Prosthecobacter sp.]